MTGLTFETSSNPRQQWWVPRALDGGILGLLETEHFSVAAAAPPPRIATAGNPSCLWLPPPGSNSPGFVEVSTAGCGVGWPRRGQEAPVLPRELLERRLYRGSWVGGLDSNLSGLIIGTGTVKQTSVRYSFPRRTCGSTWGERVTSGHAVPLCSHLAQKTPSINSILSDYWLPPP